MEIETLYNKFESLPIEAQKQVSAFIDFLQSKYQIKTKQRRLYGQGLFNEKFIGIWKDRIEFDDSSGWLKNLRKKEWK